MADQVLKFQPEQKIDSGKPTKKAGTDPAGAWSPACAAIAAFY